MKRFALLALPLAIIACGDNDDESRPIDAAADAVVIDVPTVDAPTDAPIDTPIDTPPAITYNGTLSMLEAAVLNPGTTGTFFGQGVQIGIGFNSSDTAIFPNPIMEETPGVPTGCKAWSYTHDQAIASSLGLDEGPVQMTETAGTNTQNFPPCTFTAGVGYTCPFINTGSGGGTIAVGPAPGTATLTDADVTYNAGNTTNRYVNISGATNAANNGTFPIVALGGANTIVYGNPAVVAETLPPAAPHVNLAGVGPTPSAPDPGFLADDVAVSFALTPGGGNHFAAFTMATGGTTTVGDDFVLAPASLQLLNAIPRTNAPFTISCEAGSCANLSASGILINIITTDTSVTGLSPFAMPIPTTKRLQIRCAQLGNVTSITVPAAFAALLGDAGVKRVQATVVRPNLMGLSPVTSISGHAIVGFTTIP